jgi:hypothetical protein
MPSRVLSADQEAVVTLFTRLDDEATDISQGRTDIPAAVARLAQLVPPARLDLVDEVIVRVARRDLSVTLDWPRSHVAHRLVFLVRRIHAGEVRLRGKPGEVVDLIAYTHVAGRGRRLYRLSRHGVFVGEFTTPEELGKHVDLATLTEDDEPGIAGPTSG